MQFGEIPANTAPMASAHANESQIALGMDGYLYARWFGASRLTFRIVKSADMLLENGSKAFVCLWGLVADRLSKGNGYLSWRGPTAFAGGSQFI